MQDAVADPTLEDTHAAISVAAAPWPEQRFYRGLLHHRRAKPVHIAEIVVNIPITTIYFANGARQHLRDKLHGRFVVVQQQHVVERVVRHGAT